MSPVSSSGKKKRRTSILLVLLTVFLCILFNMLAPLIDTPSLRRNTEDALNDIRIQEASPELIGGFPSARFDNFTAALILKTAAYTGNEPYWHLAFGGMRYEKVPEEDERPWDAFCAYADGSESPTGGLSYSRYWHGYTLPLRLLLSLTSFSNIQMLTYGLVFFGIIVCTMLLTRRNLSLAIPGFALAIFSLMPAAIGICIQYVPVALVTLGAGILLLLFEERIRETFSMEAFFAVVGILTCYLDLLTFPILSLCLPLVILILLDLPNKAPRTILTTCFTVCLFWGIGFAGMWILKFVINCFVYGLWAGMSVITQIQLRLSSASNGIQFSRLSSLIMNLNVLFDKTAFRLLFVLLFLYEVIRIFRAWRHNHLVLTLKACILLIPCLIPVIWMLMTSNHIYDHYYFTYRNLAGTIFAGITFLHTFFRTTDVHQAPAQ